MVKECYVWGKWVKSRCLPGTGRRSAELSDYCIYPTFAGVLMLIILYW